LSNFYPKEILYKGVKFPTNEHAFQYNKTILPEEHNLMLALAKSPVDAKRLGRKITLRDDWEEIKVRVMFEINYIKFTQNPDLRDKLVWTGFAQLIEGNTWGDMFWGVCNGQGNNVHGLVLMTVRTLLQTLG
jgi:hypothetical protein